jgi:hypothetical protein
LCGLLPADLKPNPERLGHGLLYGGASMALMLLSGVSGPLIDTYFLGGNLRIVAAVGSVFLAQGIHLLLA